MDINFQKPISQKVPLAIIMISLNEGHNMNDVLDNICGWAEEVFLVDSFSIDNTVDIALKHGVYVVQRKFQGFGDQWNFALKDLPIKSPWTMKLDPDERLSDELKFNIQFALKKKNINALSLNRRLWFMGQPLPIKQKITRIWKTGKCRFTDVIVNEHPIIKGRPFHVKGDLEHHDSPDFDHWLEKQNRYTTAEAIILFTKSALADTPKLFGSSLQRRMWLKANFYKLPFRYSLLFLYYWLIKGTWKAGWVGYIWAKLRTDVMRFIEYKYREMKLTGKLPVKRAYGTGKKHPKLSTK